MCWCRVRRCLNPACCDLCFLDGAKYKDHHATWQSETPGVAEPLRKSNETRARLLSLAVKKQRHPGETGANFEALLERSGGAFLSALPVIPTIPVAKPNIRPDILAAVVANAGCGQDRLSDAESVCKLFLYARL